MGGRKMELGVYSYKQISVDSFSGIIYLGKKNLLSLIFEWQCEKSLVEGNIKDLQFLIGTLSDRDSVLAAAREFEDPESFKLGTYCDSHTGHLEPLDEESKSRRSDATTLNRCGWCKYHGGGIFRFSYLIEGDCSIVPDMECRFDTACPLKSSSPELLANCREHLNKKLDKLYDRNEEVYQRLDILSHAVDLADDKPVFPWYRREDWGAGESEFVFFDGEGFRNGRLVSENHYGFLITERDDETAFPFLQFSPKCMTPDELMYLKVHPDYARMWLNHSDLEWPYTTEDLFDALTS